MAFGQYILKMKVLDLQTPYETLLTAGAAAKLWSPRRVRLAKLQLKFFNLNCNVQIK